MLRLVGEGIGELVTTARNLHDNTGYTDAELSVAHEAAMKGARSAGPSQDAPDVAQDVVAALLEKGRRYENLEAAMRRAGVFRAISLGRKRARAKPTPEVPERPDILDPYEAVIVRMQVEWLLARANEVISSPAEKRALRTLLESGSSIAEACDFIAKTSGQKKETVRTQMRRAVQKLQADEGVRRDY